jgi:hypothetical protein
MGAEIGGDYRVRKKVEKSKEKQKGRKGSRDWWGLTSEKRG